MKINKNIKKDRSNGTTFYKCSLNDIKENIYNRSSFTDWALTESKLNAIDLDQLPGSDVIDNYLYLCITDFDDIEINGELVDPEEALATIEITQLADYIESGTPEIISSYLSEDNLVYYSIDVVFKSMLNANYRISDILDSDLIEDRIQEIING